MSLVAVEQFTAVVPTSVPPVKSAGVFAAGAAGETVMHGRGVVGGGRITPSGTSRMLTALGETVPKPVVLVGVATTCTHVPGSPLQVPALPFGGATGDVNVTRPTPLPSVTMVRADSAPKSCTTPCTAMSTLSVSPDTRLASGPDAVDFPRDARPHADA